MTSFNQFVARLEVLVLDPDLDARRKLDPLICQRDLVEEELKEPPVDQQTLVVIIQWPPVLFLNSLGQPR